MLEVIEASVLGADAEDGLFVVMAIQHSLNAVTFTGTTRFYTAVMYHLILSKIGQNIHNCLLKEIFLEVVFFLLT